MLILLIVLGVFFIIAGIGYMFDTTEADWNSRMNELSERYKVD